MFMPGPIDKSLKVWLRTQGDIRPNVGSWHAWIDRKAGTVTSAMLPDNTPAAAHADETWVIALHYGTFGGELIRAVYAIGALVPVAVLLTGTIHWLWRRRLARACVRVIGSRDRSHRVMKCDAGLHSSSYAVDNLLCHCGQDDEENPAGLCGP